MGGMINVPRPLTIPIWSILPVRGIALTHHPSNEEGNDGAAAHPEWYIWCSIKCDAGRQIVPRYSVPRLAPIMQEYPAILFQRYEYISLFMRGLLASWGVFIIAPTFEVVPGKHAYWSRKLNRSLQYRPTFDNNLPQHFTSRPWLSSKDR